MENKNKYGFKPMSEVVNKVDDNTYDVRIYGDIGTDIDGHSLAQWLSNLSKPGVNINVRINSRGGFTHEGTSIVSELLSSKANITTINDGVAYSMAFVLLQCGKVRKSRDYSSSMVHTARFSMDKDSQLTESEKTFLEAENYKLNTILKGLMCDKFKPEWFDGTDHYFMGGMTQKNIGIVDEVINTGKTLNISSESERLNACAMLLEHEYNVNNSNSNILDMEHLKTVAAVIGCEENISVVVAKVSSLRESIAAKDTVIASKDNEIAQLKEHIKSFANIEKANLIEDGVSSGRISADKAKEFGESVASLSVEQLKSVIASMTPIHNPLPVGKNGVGLQSQSNGNFAGKTLEEVLSMEGGEAYVEKLRVSNKVEYSKLLKATKDVN